MSADDLGQAISRRRFAATAAAASGFALAVQPVAASTVKTGARGLIAGMVEVPAGDRMIPAYRAKPRGRTRRPVILVVQEIFGLHEHIRDVTRRLAQAGYYAIAPDCYVRQGDPTKLADIQTILKTIVSQVPDAQVMSDLDAAAAFAGKDGGDAAKLGVTGFCWGGRITWLYAAHNPGLKAGAAWYGRLVGEPNPLQPRHPVDVAGALKAPVLGLYGEADDGIPVATVERMRAALAAAGDTASRIELFAKAPHGFLADYRPTYRPDVAKAAWEQALGWFGSRLK